jgi:hypothetical protein
MHQEATFACFREAKETVLTSFAEGTLLVVLWILIRVVRSKCVVKETKSVFIR